MDDIDQIRLEDGSKDPGGSILIPISKIDPDGKLNVPEKEGKPMRKKIWQKKWVRLGGIVLVIFLFFISLSGIWAYSYFKKVEVVGASVLNLKLAFEEQDIDKVKQELANTEKSFQNLKNAYKTILWMKSVPWLGEYINDGQHGLNGASYGLEALKIVVEVVEPYSDIIGFVKDSEQAKSGQETAQDRLDFVIKTIPEVVPKADKLIEKVKLVKVEIDEIDPTDYPEELAGKKIRLRIEKVMELISLGSDLLEKSKPLLEASSYLLGVDSERKYLILFQNDKELRPTGGFITAYSIAKVKNAKFEAVESSDIYNLDSHYTPSLTAPEPLIKYLKGPYILSRKYRLRDINWSPDFEESMRLFTQEAEKVGIKNVDGVIGVDTQLLVNILNVIGPIGVPGYGEFSTKIISDCNCPQVIYELESFADIEGPVVWSENEPGKIVFAPPNYDNRKKIIGPLMNSVLANALGQPKDKIPQLAEAILRSLIEKHVLFYLTDEKAQAAVESFEIAGKLKDNYQHDFLFINDANLGGRKSNLYVKEEVLQEVEIGKDGSVVKTLTITYNNPEKYDGWLNSLLPNWVRIYVPKGSELIEFSGVEDRENPYEELGKTVFAGFFELRPQGIVKVIARYRLPFKVSLVYKLYIQKQPGKDAPSYLITLGKKQEEFFLRMDGELKIKI
ncbi:hypothetical protein A2686_03125 [Candidatus Woesebacteria bacterium RIFCSPHIGHO2_01_FULL_38_10]|uniref:DUF4012 domain-containing protein n=1 Tax=Candidatus Woesebacteria bacterium RIFCSPLOWO2_01_FULL_39_10b TaxID=1802517 RepID=A0A1F8B5W2_9BACT|nr:MAG: hypothetical protein A2686_03125 [Candidatus Woesebacteria bacterium RIFCSPHIGHO2_01_FULL_38_10]OGM59300.1 MAG: hypothetical protein A2892_05560 [Candidatus Woesebacteria bacterium RIFCSPLOWO2_01_FULL_39_10b]